MRLQQDFFARDAETVARDLVGKVLCHRTEGGVQRVRIVETEAYVGPHDAACHARVGVTPRTEVLHGPAGRAYVYLVYGLHDMLNVVTGPEGHGEAVLIRAAEPIEGVSGRTDGPARLCKALGVRVASHNRIDLGGDTLWIEDGSPPQRMGVAPRIGIDYAGDWADAPLRFFDADSPCVSVRPRAPADPPSGRRATGSRRSGPDRAGLP